jgi:hypothetical protein
MMELNSEPHYLLDLALIVLQFGWALVRYSAPINLLLLPVFFWRRRTPQQRRWKRAAGWLAYGYGIASVLVTPVALLTWMHEVTLDWELPLLMAAPPYLGALTWFLAFRRPVVPEAAPGLFASSAPHRSM